MRRTIYLLERYKNLGITFRLSGRDVKINIPKGVSLSEDKIAELRTKKNNIFKILYFCPARSKTDMRCYGVAYYEKKPSKKLLFCDMSTCRWKDKRYNLMMEGYAVEGGEVIIYAESSCVG